jgi:hypothetical protein
MLAAQRAAESPRNRKPQKSGIGALRRLGRPKLPTPHTTAESSPKFFGSAENLRPRPRRSARRRMAEQTRSPGGSAARRDPALRSLAEEHARGQLISPHPRDVDNVFWRGRGGAALRRSAERRRGDRGSLGSLRRSALARALPRGRSPGGAGGELRRAEITSSSDTSSRETSPQPSPHGAQNVNPNLFPVSQAEADEIAQFAAFLETPLLDGSMF